MPLPGVINKGTKLNIQAGLLQHPSPKAWHIASHLSITYEQKLLI